MFSVISILSNVEVFLLGIQRKLLQIWNKIQKNDL